VAKDIGETYQPREKAVEIHPKLESILKVAAAIIVTILLFVIAARNAAPAGVSDRTAIWLLVTGFILILWGLEPLARGLFEKPRPSPPAI
jgi:hypothetical protein